MVDQLKQLNPAVAIALIIGVVVILGIFIWQTQKTFREY